MYHHHLPSYASLAAPAQGCMCEEGPCNIVTTRDADMVCTGCGTVLQSHMFDERPEYYNDLSQARFTPPSCDDALLGIEGKVTLQRRPSRATAVTESATIRACKAGFADIERFAARMGLDRDHSMIVSAKEMYKDFYAKKKIREDQRLAHAACAVYLGCKAHAQACDRHPRSLREMEDLCGRPLHDVVKSYKNVLGGEKYFKLLLQGVRPVDVLPRKMEAVASAIKTMTSVHLRTLGKEARDLFQRIDAEHALEGRTPEAICAAVLFHICSDKLKISVNKRTVADAVGVAPLTLTNTLKDLQCMLSE